MQDEEKGGQKVPVLLRGRGFKKKLFHKKGKNQTERKEKTNRRTRNKPWPGISTEEMKTKMRR